MKKVLPIIFIILISGCDGLFTPPAKFEVNTEDPLINKALPYIIEICPGFSKYATSFNDIKKGGENEIVFGIKAENKIPPELLNGKTQCTLSIIPNGSYITFSSDSCQNICLNNNSHASVNHIYLNESLTKQLLPNKESLTLPQQVDLAEQLLHEVVETKKKQIARTVNWPKN